MCPPLSPSHRYNEINITDNRHFAHVYLLGITRLTFTQSMAQEWSIHLHFRFPSEDCECDIDGDGCGCFSDLYYYLGTCVDSDVILDNLFGEVGVDGHLVSFFIYRQSPIFFILLSKQCYNFQHCKYGIFCHSQAVTAKKKH